MKLITTESTIEKCIKNHLNDNESETTVIPNSFKQN